MKRTLLITGFFVLLASSFIGFMGSHYITELQAEVESIEEYDDTAITSSLNTLISTINNLNTSNSDELATQVGLIQNKLDAIEEYDDSSLEARVTELETLVQDLTTLLSTLQNNINSLESNGSTTPQLYLNSQGQYLDFSEIANELCVKYLDYDDEFSGCNSGWGPEYKALSVFTLSNSFSTEEILARMVLLIEEFSQYKQYFSFFETMELTFTYGVAEDSYRYTVTFPTTYITSGLFKPQDILPGGLWTNNRCVFEEFSDFGVTTTALPINTELFEQTYNTFVTNNTFGNDILIPME